MHGTAERVALLSALLMATLTYCHYTCFLISALSVSKLDLPFATMEEMMRTNTHQLVVLEGAVTEMAIKVRRVLEWTGGCVVDGKGGGW